MVDRQHFIKAMRGVAHSVTIVSTEGSHGHHGATVSAFCSVSADPPTVLVCLNTNSSITDNVLGNGQFVVTVLPDDAAFLADRFAGRHDKDIANRFEGIQTDKGAPVVEGAAVFECKVENSVQSGSHQIVIGSVVSCLQGDENPLTYLSGDYHCARKLPQAAE